MKHFKHVFFLLCGLASLLARRKENTQIKLQIMNFVLTMFSYGTWTSKSRNQWYIIRYFLYVCKNHLINHEMALFTLQISMLVSLVTAYRGGDEIF